MKMPEPRQRKAVWMGVLLILIVLLVTVGGLFPSLPDTSAPSGDGVPQSAAQTSNLCVGEDEYRFDDGETRISVPVYTNCWSGWIITPPDSDDWWADPPTGANIALLFPDGSVANDLDGVNWLGEKRGIFRLRSIGGEGDAFVNIEY